MKPKSAFRLVRTGSRLFAIAIVSLLAAQSARATTHVWDAGGSPATTWTTQLNWSDDLTQLFAAGDTFDLSTLNITGNSISTVDANATLGIINIGDFATSSNSWTLDSSGGAILTLDNGGSNSQINQTSTSFGDTISVPLALAGSLDIVNASAAKSLTLSGGITSSATIGTQTLSNLGSATGGLVIGAAISDGLTGGKIAVVQNNANGRLTLSGANTYTGSSTLSAGTLVANHATALGDGGDITFTGGTLQYAAASAGQDWGARFKNSTSAIRLNTADQNITLTNIIDSSNTGGLTFIGNAAAGLTTSLTLNGANTYSGTTFISGATNQSWTILKAGSSTAFGPATTASLQFAQPAGQCRNIIDLNGNSMTVIGLNAPDGNDGGGYGSFGSYLVNKLVATTSTLTVNNTVDNYYGGCLSDVGTGVLALIKDGPGTLTLRSFNTYSNYSGGLTIKNGTFDPNGIDQGTMGTGVIATVMGDAGGKTGTLVANSGTTSRTFTMATGGSGAFQTPSGGTATLSGIVNGSGNFGKSGAGTLTLSGVNSFLGATTVTGGTLKLDGTTNNTSKLSDTAALILAGGTLDLSAGSHLEVVASTTLNAGRSQVTRSGGTGLLSMNEITRNPGAMINFGATNIAQALTLNNSGGILGAYATVNDTWATSAAIQTPSTVWGVDGVIQLGGQTDGNSVTFSGTAPAGLNTSTVYYVRDAFTTGFYLAATPGGAVIALTDTGSATVKTSGLISGLATYSDINALGSTVPNTATANVRINGAGSGLIDTLAATTTTINTLLQATASIANIDTVGKTLQVNGIMVASGQQTLNIGASAGDGFLQPATAGGELTLINNGTNLLTINSSIANNTSASNVTKAGIGKVLLAGASTFSGGIDLVAGTLVLANSGTSATNSALGTGTLVIGAGITLDSFNASAYATNNAVTINGDFTFTGTRSLNLGTGNVTLGTAPGTSRTITVNGNILTFGGAIGIGTTANSLIKVGGATLALNGASTYTGTTMISAGTLSANNIVVSAGGSSLGNATSAVVLGDAGNRGTLSYTGGVANYTRGFTVSAGGGTLTHAGSGLLTVSGAGIAIATNTEFRVGGASQNISISSIISGSNSSLTKNGFDTVALGGANTYTGSTTVNAGTLTVTGSLNGTSGTALILGNGTFNVSEASGVSQNMGAISFGGGEGTIQSTNNGGNSFLTFSSALPVPGNGNSNAINLVISGGVNGTTNKIVPTGQAAGFIRRMSFFGGNDYAYYDAAGFVRGINYGTDANTATTAGGTSAASTTNLNVTGNITAQASGTSFTTIRLSGSSNFTLTPNATVNARNVTDGGFGILKTGGGTSTISGGTLLMPNGYYNNNVADDFSSSLVIRAVDATDNLIINSNLISRRAGVPGLPNWVNAFNKWGAGNVTLNGNNNLSATPMINGGGTVTLTAQNYFATAGGSGEFAVGNYSAGNTLNLTGAAKLASAANGTQTLNIGGGLFGSNAVNIAAPGTPGAVTWNVSSINLGLATDGNSLKIANSAYVRCPNGFNVGTSGGSGNAVRVTGAGTQLRIDANNGSTITVGSSGSSNSLEVSAGAVFRPARLQSGSSGGSNNSTLVTGVGSVLNFGGTQTGLVVGNSGGSGNSLTVQDGGYVNAISGSRASEAFVIGGSNSSNDNYVRVTGVGSLLNIAYSPAPYTIGGDKGVSAVASGNHLDVYGGGYLNQTAGSSTSLYVMGISSAFNLGNGTGISTAKIGQNSGFVAGVNLANADSRLNFNSGRLIAGVNGALVSGLGQVQLNGPACISTTQAASTITSVIAGGTGNSLIKEGSGNLILFAANTYTGGTVVTNGTLALDYTVVGSKLADAGSLTLAGGTLDLRNGATPHVEIVASTALGAGRSNVTRTSGSSLLRMNAITPGVGIVNIAAGTIAFTSNALDDGGIYGAWVTVGGTDWATTDFNEDVLGSGNYTIVANTIYTDINALGSTISNGFDTNVRLNAAGAGSNIALMPGTTTINTLLQSTTTPATVTLASGDVLALNGIMVATGKEAVTIGLNTTNGSLKTATAGANLVLNYSGVPTQAQVDTATVVAPAGVLSDGLCSVVVTSAAFGSPVTVVVPLTTAAETSADLIASVIRNYLSLDAAVAAKFSIGGAGSDITASRRVDANGYYPADDATLNIDIPGVLGITAAPTSTNTTFGEAGVMTINTPIVANGASGLATAGPLILNGVNTYTGPTGVGGALTIGGAGQLGGGTYAGAISIAAGASLTMNSSATQILGGDISGYGVITQSGTGTTTLSGANTYTGVTTVNAGILKAGSATAFGPATDAALAFGSGSTGKVQLNGNSIAIARLSTDVTLGTPIIESGSSTPGIDTLTLAAWRDNTTGTINNYVNNSYAGVLQDGGIRKLALVKNGVGILTLGGTNTYSGGTTINGGVISLANQTGFGTGSVSLASTTTFQQTAFVDSDGSTSAGAILNPIVLGSGDANSAGEVYIVLGTTVKPMWLSGDVSGDGRIRLVSDSTALGNTGILTLSGAKTFTGGIIQAGHSSTPGSNTTVNLYPSVQIDNVASLGTGIFRAQVVGADNTKGFVRAIANLSGGSGVTTAFDIAAGARLVLDGTSPNDLKISGVISGGGIGNNIGGLAFAGGVLVKTGTNTLTLSGANIYGGGTIVNAGALTGIGDSPLGATTGPLQVNNAGTILNLSSTVATRTGSLSGNDAGATINNGGQMLTVDQTAVLEYMGVIAGSGGFTLGDLSSAVLTLSGANSYQGGTTVNVGTLTGAGTTPLGATTGPLTVNNVNNWGVGTAVVLNLSITAPTTTGSLGGAIATPLSGTNTATINNGGQLLTVNQTSAGTYAGVIAGNGGLTLGSLSTHALTLIGANTYIGGTTVSAGTLLVSNTSGSGTGSGAVTVASGATLGGTGSISGSTTIQGLAVHSPGASAGIQTFTGGLAYAANSKLLWQLNDNVTVGRGTLYDGVNATGGTFSIDSLATLDLSFGGSVSFVDSFWNVAHSWTVADLGIGVTDSAPAAVFALGSISGGGYSLLEGNFSVTRVDPGDGKKDVMLEWTAAAVVGAPEIAIDQASGNINTGGSKAFPTAVVVGANDSLTFTIANTGNADLDLTGSPKVAISGDADFTVTAQPVSPVSGPTGTTTFTVKFAPSATGTRNAVVTILNNDGDEGTFTINLSGSGTTAYEQWATSKSLLGADRNFDADPDLDGIKNGLEWVLGGNPKANDSPSVLPVVTGNVATGLTLVFGRETTSIPETDLIVQWDTTLPPAANDLPVGVSDSSAAGGVTVDVDYLTPGKVKVNIPNANASARKLFGRMKVTQKTVIVP